jgi:hypothetical protein
MIISVVSSRAQSPGLDSPFDCVKPVAQPSRSTFRTVEETIVKKNLRKST